MPIVMNQLKTSPVEAKLREILFKLLPKYTTNCLRSGLDVSASSGPGAEHATATGWTREASEDEVGHQKVPLIQISSPAYWLQLTLAS